MSMKVRNCEVLVEFLAISREPSGIFGLESSTLCTTLSGIDTQFQEGLYWSNVWGMRIL